MTGRLRSIPLGSIITHPRLQNRNAAAPCMQHRLPLTPATQEHLEDLRLAISRGESLPPVLVVQAEDDKPNRFYLVDGYHRYWAHRVLNMESIGSCLLDGKGFTDALIASGRANKNHGLRLTKDQKTENAWRALNLPESDYYRRLNKTQAEGALGIDRETIKKMRQNVRQQGVERGRIDPGLKGKAAEEALLSYWNENPSPDTWRMARRGTGPERKDAKWQVKRVCLALAQTLTNYEAVYGPEVAKAALYEVGHHLLNIKPPEGMAKVRRAYSVAPQPIPSDDEVILSGTALEEFLEWQRQQDFGHQSPPAFNDHNPTHNLPSDF